MQFELTHQDLKEAIHEFIRKKGVAENNEIDMLIKTSRKGGRTSRAIITVLDTPIVQQATTQAPTGAGIASFVASVLGTNAFTVTQEEVNEELQEEQLDIPFSVGEEEEVTTTQEVEEVTEPSPTFKRLFA